MKNIVNYFVSTKLGEPQSLTMIIDGRPVCLSAGHLSFHLVLKELKSKNPSVDKLKGLMTAKNAIKSYSGDKLVEVDGKYFYQCVEINNIVINRARDFMERGINAKPLLRFLENLMQNPSERSRTMLFSFLENLHLTYTPDGYFTGYKGITEDCWSIHTGNHTMLSGRQNDNGAIFNGRNEKILVPWDEVDDNPDNGCSHGLHVGSYDYAKSWSGQNGKLAWVKVHPKNVVCVPNAEKEKMRVCGYEVLDILWAKEPVKQTFDARTVDKDDEDAAYYNKRDKYGRFAR